jgi:uncharacterized protein (DUF1697 family)
MTRYAAFLRGINVGGHTVKMDRLKAIFEALGFSAVSTFIASGNVVFETGETDRKALERRIEQALEQALGYEVATFVRTGAEVAEIAAHEPFPNAPSREGDTLHVIFLRYAPDADTRARVQALSNDEDLLRFHGSELYWLRRGKMMDSTLDQAAFAGALGKAPTTARNANTLRRLAAKHPAGV